MEKQKISITNNHIRHSLLLGFASIIWGISFVVQQVGGMELGAYTFNGIRMLIGALAVYLVTFVFDKKGYGGFLTAVYILIVPILGLFFKTKCRLNVWVAVGIALLGLYFLCIKGSFSLQTPDLLLLGCAFAFALQIMTIDRFGGMCDSLRLSAIEFLVTGVISMVLAAIFEIIPFDGGMMQWIAQFASWKVWLKLAMDQFKRAGENKEYAIRAVKSSWEADTGFKKRFTDGTDADLQSAIDFINTHWDAV